MPALPSVVLGEIKAHRSFVHETTSILGACGDLEEKYAASLEYHYRAITAEIVTDAENRWAKGRAS